MLLPARSVALEVRHPPPRHLGLFELRRAVTGPTGLIGDGAKGTCRLVVAPA
ncbi:MAG: hypothetical protein IPK72_03735 [Candidatus Eisenbacteria bacterium]|nr:hypothetical protein [Candidatus Eisenbacteria bacterium]